MGNQERAIQRNGQRLVYKTQNEDKHNKKHNKTPKRWATRTNQRPGLNPGAHAATAPLVSHKTATMSLILSRYVGPHYTHTNTNNAYKTWALLQTIGVKDEPNIHFYAGIRADITTRN